jgi:hypothetical protein
MPPSASMLARVIAKPRPVPSALRWAQDLSTRQKRSNRHGRCSGQIGVPALSENGGAFPSLRLAHTFTWLPLGACLTPGGPCAGARRQAFEIALQALPRGVDLLCWRRTLPEGSNLSVHSPADLHAIAFHHIAKPGKSSGWKSPAELLAPTRSTVEPTAQVLSTLLHLELECAQRLFLRRGRSVHPSPQHCAGPL